MVPKNDGPNWSRNGSQDALYFRVSSDRQTTENHRRPTSNGGTRTVYRVRPDIARELARECIYVEQGRSGKSGAKQRPLFQQMKRDASTRRFDRLLVWKVSCLGRDMREVISTVYELADLGVTVIPIKSQTGPINSTMGKLLWAIADAALRGNVLKADRGGLNGERQSPHEQTRGACWNRKIPPKPRGRHGFRYFSKSTKCS